VNMNGQWVVEPLFSVFQDDFRNKAHQDHEPNQGHKPGECILVPWVPDQKLRVIGIAQETAPAESRLRAVVSQSDLPRFSRLSRTAGLF
jgi:hypothetical protein